MILVSLFSGVGLFVFGVYIGMQISIKRYLDNVEKTDKIKAIKREIKRRDKAEFLERMSDQEAREEDRNSVERINKEVV